ncbi:MAG TPA: DUF599 family protein [Xanthobacteraceae bacterium]|nr:DUF599 family protein [Xanthobacteraceae bacterium]
MVFLSVPDLTALAFFLVAWAAYALVIEWTEHGSRGLNAEMDRYRETWMREMLARQNRIVDSHITSSLQNGTAFFASTSLIAIGGALTLLRSTDEMLAVFGGLPFGITATRTEWETKTLGLAIIFVYAFFKFSWSYRLFNYFSILLGATPPLEEKDTPEALAHARRAAKLSEEAGRHFNRGQRAFFLALGYLGWFVSPWVFMATTAAVLIVMWRRQLASPARRALER